MRLHSLLLNVRRRRRAKTLANQSKMQLSLLDMEQQELLLIAVAHKFMQLKTHNKRINPRRRSFVGHILMALVQLVAHYSLCWKSISDISVNILHTIVVHFKIVVKDEHRRNNYDCRGAVLFFPSLFPCWHSCLSERKYPTLTSYSWSSQLPPSDFVHFATWSDSVCRIRSHSQPHDKSHAVSEHMESPSSVYMLFHFFRITHNACRLPRIWNPSLSPSRGNTITNVNTTIIHIWQILKKKGE